MAVNISALTVGEEVTLTNSYSSPPEFLGQATIIHVLPDSVSDLNTPNLLGEFAVKPYGYTALIWFSPHVGVDMDENGVITTDIMARQTNISPF